MTDAMAAREDAWNMITRVKRTEADGAFARVGHEGSWRGRENDVE